MVACVDAVIHVRKINHLPAYSSPNEESFEDWACSSCLRVPEGRVATLLLEYLGQDEV